MTTTDTLMCFCVVCVLTLAIIAFCLWLEVRRNQQWNSMRFDQAAKEIRDLEKGHAAGLREMGAVASGVADLRDEIRELGELHQLDDIVKYQTGRLEALEKEQRDMAGDFVLLAESVNRHADERGKPRTSARIPFSRLRAQAEAGERRKAEGAVQSEVNHYA